MPLINIVNSLGSKTIHFYNGTPYLTRTSPLRKHHPFAEKIPKEFTANSNGPTLAVMPFHLGVFFWGIGSWKKKTWGGTVGVFTPCLGPMSLHIILMWMSLVMFSSLKVHGWVPNHSFQGPTHLSIPVHQWGSSAYRSYRWKSQGITRLQPTGHRRFFSSSSPSSPTSSKSHWWR